MGFKINKIQINSDLQHKSLDVSCYFSNSYDNVKTSNLISDFIVDSKSRFCLLINEKPNFALINMLIYSPFYLKINNKLILFIDKSFNSRYSDQISKHINELGFTNILLYSIDLKETYIISDKGLKKFYDFESEIELLFELALSNFIIIGDDENLIEAENKINQSLKNNNQIKPFIENTLTLNKKNIELNKQLFYATTDLKNNRINLEIQTKNLQKELEWYKNEIDKINNWGHTEIKKTKEYYENKYENIPQWFIILGNIFFNRKNKS